METVQWLEQQGYNVSYTEDLQVDRTRLRCCNHKVFLISGHSEYWSMAEYNNIMAARNAGVSVVSLSGNTGLLEDAVHDNYRTLVCYKTVQGPDTPNDPASLNSSGQVGPGDNPSLATTTRRDAGAIAGTAGAPAGGRIGPNTPENQLLGSMYIGDNDSEYWGLTIPASDGFGNYAGNDLWRNSGVSTTTATTISNDIVGWEWDTIPSASSPLYAYAASVEPAGVQSIASTDISKTVADTPDSFIQDYGNLRATTVPPGQSPTSTATIYRAASGAYVFAAGTILWANGFDDPRIEQVTYNVDVRHGRPAGDPGRTSPWTPGPPGRGHRSPSRPTRSTSATPSTLNASGTTTAPGRRSPATSGTSTATGPGSTTAPAPPSATRGRPGDLQRPPEGDRRAGAPASPPVCSPCSAAPADASLVVNPAKPVVGQTVTLDGSGSSGPANPITDYKWDLTAAAPIERTPAPRRRRPRRSHRRLPHRRPAGHRQQGRDGDDDRPGHSARHRRLAATRTPSTRPRG